MRKTAADLDPVLPLSYFHVRLHVREIPSPLTMATGSQTHVNNAEEPASARPSCTSAALVHISSVSFTPQNTSKPHAQHPKANVSIETSRLP